MPTADQLKADGDKFQMAGRGDRAIDYYQKAHLVYLEQKNTPEAIECMQKIGLALVFSDQEKAGITALQKALDEAKKHHFIVDIGRIHRDLGIAYMIYRHYYDSLEHLEASRAVLANSSAIAEIGLTEAKLGRLYALNGEYSRVDECFDVAYQYVNKAGNSDHLLIVQIDNAFACLERGQIGHLENHLKTAWDLLLEMRQLDLQRRRVAQIHGLQVRLAINRREWLIAKSIYNGDFSAVLEDFSPSCAITLRYELKTQEIESLNF